MKLFEVWGFHKMFIVRASSKEEAIKLTKSQIPTKLLIYGDEAKEIDIQGPAEIVAYCEE